MKLILAGSVAIIMALILFLPGVKQTPIPRASERNRAPSVLENQGAISEQPTSASPVSKKSAERRAKTKQRAQEIQEELRILLSGSPAKLEEAGKRIRLRRREVVLEKILLLGEEDSSEDRPSNAEAKLILDTLDSELKTLSEQEQLLNSLNQSAAPDHL
jgi:hypothetical protein